jgi:diacylglycerol kinase (ATP)
MTTAASAIKPVCIIYNPTARGERARRMQAKLQSLRSQCSLHPSLAAGEARHLAAEAVREGFETIVAMGGDGTVNEVLNGIADEPNGFQRARLAVLPVGTVNVFARELGIPIHFQRAWSIIQRGQEMTIDLPEMGFAAPQGPQRRWFAQMAGCGLDARAVELMDWKLKKKIGQLAYVVSGFKALRETPACIHVSHGGRTYTGQLVLLGNGRLYGGPIPVFERADLQDGHVDVCVFPKVNWLVVLRYACAYLSPKLLRRGTEHYFHAESVRIESAVRTPVELDGEHVGHLPASCSVRRRALRVVVPDGVCSTVSRDTGSNLR